MRFWKLPHFQFPFRLATLATGVSAGVLSVGAQEKITFQDHVLPLVENHCGKCHNSDKKKGDLDLSSFSGVMAGAASGKVVVAGDPDSSKLVKVVTHAEEPTMPPNKSKLPDVELAVFRKWIAGGLLETLGSKAIAAQKPSVDLSLKGAPVGKPEGAAPMPGDLLLEPVVVSARGSAVTGLASSPWAPVIAVTGQKQILLYHPDSRELLGVLPYTEGQPVDVRFSRNGKLLVAGGGHGGKSGRVVVWDITTGEKIVTLGEEFDVVLTSDISPDQTRIALGGPSRLVKIYSTQSGQALVKMKKHTDWVTALAFSPNGSFLATADRNGGAVVWDAENGQELFTLAGHKSAVTALSWRGDSKLLATAGEDGAIKLWEMQDGKQARTWAAHTGGALSVAYTHDGRLVSSGRDNQIVSWDGEGKKLKAYEFTGELPNRVTFTHDGTRVIASDWTGLLHIWQATDGKRVGELPTNPPSLAERIATVKRRLGDPAKTNETQLLTGELSRLEQAQTHSAIYGLGASIAQKKLEHARLEAQGDKKTQEAAKKLSLTIADEEKQLANLRVAYEKSRKQDPVKQTRL